MGTTTGIEYPAGHRRALALFRLQFPLANLCMCVLLAWTASGPNPLVARLAAEMVALRQPGTPSPRPAPLVPGRPASGSWFSACA
jgi:hypothetical protein